MRLREDIQSRGVRNRKDTEMKQAVEKGLILAIGIAVVFSAGCQEEQMPDQKRSRLIAAENIKLKKELGQREDEVARLKESMETESAKQASLLSECKKQQEELKVQLMDKSKKQVEEILQAAIDQNAATMAENELLKRRVEELEAELAKAKDSG